MCPSPKYANATAETETAAAPPEPTGRRLAGYPRRTAEGEFELRVTLDEYEGHPFVSLRLWKRDREGRWWPTRKGVSVRLSEAEGVAQALQLAKRIAGAAGRSDRAPDRRPGRYDASLPPTADRDSGAPWEDL